MKISVLSENLKSALGVVGRAVSSKSTLPVLANVLMSTDNGRLKLSATNLEMGITCWIGARIDEEGSTTVPAKTFSDLVNTLPSEQVKLSLVEKTQTLKIQCGTTKTDIKCIDANEFPPISQANLGDGIQFQTGDLKEMIKQTVFAASTDEARPILTGVLIAINKNQVDLQAADGFRLAMRKAELPEMVSNPVRIVVPARALNELVRIANDETVIMVVPKGRGQVIFHMKDIELVSQLIEGNFPDMDQIVPRSYKTRTILPTAAFLKACKQAEIFVRDGSNIAKIKVNTSNNGDSAKVEVSGASDERGFNNTDIDATVEGDPILIAFNVRYLQDTLDVIRTPNIALETTTDTSPGVIKPVDDSKYSVIIMPMHLGN